MGIRLHFWGAAQTVTGSSHHLECAGRNILLDCGLFQGRRQEAQEIVQELLADDIAEIKLLQEHLHDGIGQLVYDRTRRRPMILPVVVEV